MLNGDDQSVSDQLLTMSDNHLVYQMINFCRGFETSSSKNGELSNFIDQGFVSFQVTSIRAISDDTQPNSLSLINAINFLRINREYFTRKNYVCHGGFPYFWKRAKKKFRKELCQRVEENPEQSVTVESGNWSKTKGRHDQFDKLSFTKNVSERAPNDLVDDRVFKRLLSELKKCHDIGKLYANTMVAHRQNEEGRRILTKNDIVLTIDQISNCHQILWTVFNTINSYFLQDSFSPTISKISNRYLCLDSPWVSQNNLDKYHAELDKLSNEMEHDLGYMVESFQT